MAERLRGRRGAVGRVSVVVAVTLLGLCGAGAAVAHEPPPVGRISRPAALQEQCVQTGLGLLRERRMLVDVVLRRVDFASVDPSGRGLLAYGLKPGTIAVELPDASTWGLRRFERALRHHPEWFSFCRD